MPKAATTKADPAAEAEGVTTAEDKPDKPGKIDRPPARDLDDFDSMKNLSDSEEYLKILWWGTEGTGKTTNLATAAERGRVLVINAEGGLKKKPLRDLGIPLENIIPWPDPESGIEVTVETMTDLFWRIRARLTADPGFFFGVAWDSASDIYTRFVSEVRRKEYEKNERLKQTSPAKAKEFREDPYFTDRADYGVATEQLRDLLRKFRDLPCHLLVTALERRDIDPDTSKVAYGPGVGPAFQKDLLGYLDIIVNTKASTLQCGPDDEIDVVDSFRGLTRANGRSRAKDRLRSVPRVMANPSFERILSYVNDTLTEDDDPVQKSWIEAKRVDAAWASGANDPAPDVAGTEDAGTETGPVDS